LQVAIACPIKSLQAHLVVLFQALSFLLHVTLTCSLSSCCRHFPGELQKVLEWFRDYKIPDGKPANKFGYDNKCLNKEFALKVRHIASHAAVVSIHVCLRPVRTAM
jgi:hypothetical protein